jgi:hypothetical protein
MQMRLPIARFRPSQRIPACRSLAATLLLACAAISSPAAPPAQPTDNDVKAGNLLNFGRFMRHSNARQPRPSFDICILGQDPLGRGIDDIAARESINSLPIHIRRLPDVTDAKACEIVFIAADEGDRIREDLALLTGSDALTVSDAADFLDRGGMIQFLLIENHVRFSVNLNAVNRAHIILSSDLLRVASSVTGKPSTEGAP